MILIGSAKDLTWIFGGDNDFVDGNGDAEKGEDDGDDDDNEPGTWPWRPQGGRQRDPRMRFGPNSWASVALHPRHNHHQAGTICNNLDLEFSEYVWYIGVQMIVIAAKRRFGHLGFFPHNPVSRDESVPKCFCRKFRYGRAHGISLDRSFGCLIDWCDSTSGADNYGLNHLHLGCLLSSHSDYQLIDTFGKYW